MFAIQILGVKGYFRTMQLKQNVEQALSNLKLDLQVEEVTEVNRLMAYQINNIPALVIKGKVVAEKQIPEVAELEIMFKNIFQ